MILTYTFGSLSAFKVCPFGEATNDLFIFKQSYHYWSLMPVQIKTLSQEDLNQREVHEIPKPALKIYFYEVKMQQPMEYRKIDSTMVQINISIMSKRNDELGIFQRLPRYHSPVKQVAAPENLTLKLDQQEDITANDLCKPSEKEHKKLSPEQIIYLNEQRRKGNLPHHFLRDTNTWNEPQQSSLNQGQPMPDLANISEGLQND